MTDGESTKKRLGDFEIIRELGRGGMGIVYEARQVSLNRKVALKVIANSLGLSSKAVLRFRREAEAAGKLHHTNIVPIYSTGQEDATHYYAMELIDGPSLHQVIRSLRRRGEDSAEVSDSAPTLAAAPEPSVPTNASPLDSSSGEAEPPAWVSELLGSASVTGDIAPARSSGSRTGSSSLRSSGDYFDTVARMIAGVADALEHAHGNGVIHRDIKPANLLLSRDSRLSINDFGLARMLEQPGMTLSGEFVGSPLYMSPEQIAAGRAPLDHRTDIYSLGATLYELLTLEPPFRGRSRDEVIAQIIHKEPLAPRRHNRKVPVDLETICLKAMEKDPDRRYQTARALAEDLLRFVNRYAITAKRVGPLGKAVKFVGRHKLPAAASVLVVVSILVASVLIWRYETKYRRVRLERNLSAIQKLHAEGRYQDALSRIERVLEDGDVAVETRLLHARLLAELNRGAEAIVKLETLVAEDSVGAAHYLLAGLYRERDPEKAEEHRTLAEGLLPETADAYHLRAISADTLQETLKWLSDALELDPRHYPALKARALAHYALRDYENLEREAFSMILLRPEDALGYSLRAIAFRELGRLDDALREHDRAVERARDDPEVLDRRRETHYRRESFDAALADARRCVELRPAEISYRFHEFTALTALGRFAEAEAVSSEIVKTRPAARERLQALARKHVFTCLGRGQAVRLPDGKLKNLTFFAMREAADYYRRLKTKADRIAAQGFRSAWSPDGTELAYSRGIPGSNGIEIFDSKTGKARLLTVPGKDPAWSPDGRTIAFIVEYQTRDVTELGAQPELRYLPNYEVNEEVWVIKPTGEGLRRLTRGGFPTWGRTSQRLYFHSRDERMLYSLDVHQAHDKPAKVLPCPSSYPSISPDEKYVAYGLGAVLHVVEISNPSRVVTWRAPRTQGLLVEWSPDGKEISLGGFDDSDLGLWIFDLEEQEAFKVLDGPATAGVWSSDRTKLAFDLRIPYFEIWVAELDPDLPAREALSPTQTREEHYESLLRDLGRAIESGDVDAFHERGHIREALGQWQEMAADFTVSLKGSPRNLHLLHGRALAHLFMGDAQKLIADRNTAEAILAERGVPAHSYDTQALLYLMGPPGTRDPERALPLARKAALLNPRSSGYRLTLALAHCRVDDVTRAAEILGEILKSGNARGLDHLVLAMIHEKLGEREKAKEHYERALKWSDMWKPLSSHEAASLALLRAEVEAILEKQ